MDYHSRYPEVACLPSTNATPAIKSLQNIFARRGDPMTVISDNGLRFACEVFTDFAKAYDYQHVYCSPPYPQDNGASKKLVLTVKLILEKAQRIHFLLSWLNLIHKGQWDEVQLQLS